MDKKTEHKRIDPPFKVEEGKKPYIFISYKHEDDIRVYPIIKKFHDLGLNIWYDQGLPKGLNYDIQIANHILNSSLFVTFITKEVMRCANDQKDYLIRELKVAEYADKNYLPIYLDDIRLEGFYLMHYLGIQSIYLRDYCDEESFINACMETFENDFNIRAGEVEKPESSPIQLNGADLGIENGGAAESTGTRPFQAYCGDEASLSDKPYIYVSYAHSDGKSVIGDIERFRNLGVNLWYDQDIIPGLDWNAQIANAISGCSAVMIFLSRNSVESVNVRNEIFFALDLKIPIIPIYIEETELKYGLKLTLGNMQSIPKYALPDEIYIKECLKLFEREKFI